MTQLTQDDVQPYFDMYKSKYNVDAFAFFTVDDIEGYLNEADSDDAVITMMHEHMGEAPTPVATDEQPITALPAKLDVAVVDTTIGSPYSYAIKFDGEFERDLETLAEAALQNKRGAAVIMNDLFRMFGEDTVVNAWPKPNTWKAGHGPKEMQVGDNVPFDKRNTIVRKPDGTTAEGTWSFYSELVSTSARGATILAQIEKAKGSVTVVDKVTDLAGLQLKLSNFKSAIIRAVELAKRIDFCNRYTKLGAEIVTEAIDGQRVPKRSTKLIFVRDIDDRTKFNVLSIGQFLGKPVKEGATYAEFKSTQIGNQTSGKHPKARDQHQHFIQFEETQLQYRH